MAVTFVWAASGPNSDNVSGGGREILISWALKAIWIGIISIKVRSGWFDWREES